MAAIRFHPGATALPDLGVPIVRLLGLPSVARRGSHFSAGSIDL